MELTATETGLLAWASAVTGVERSCVLFENQPRVRHNGRLCLLSWVSSVGVGTDDRRWAFTANQDATQEMTPEIIGPRVCVLQLSVEVHDQRVGQTARAALEGVRERAQAPSSLRALKQVNVALADIGAVVKADYIVDGRWISRCTLDVTLNATGQFTDTAGRTNYIATVGLSSTVTNPDGTAVPSAAAPGGTLP